MYSTPDNACAVYDFEQKLNMWYMILNILLETDLCTSQIDLNVISGHLSQ